MAEGHGHVMKLAHPAATALLAVLAAAIAAGFLPVLWLGLGEGGRAFDSYTLRVLIFTLWQAALSTLLSVALGVPTALALARRRFWGRELFISLLALPLALPQIVVVLGLVALIGAEGWFPGALPLYGLSGILLAHVFFNAALIARLTLSALQSIPAEQLRLAAQLGFSDLAHLRLVDAPVLRQAVPGSALLVFLLCAASFTIVLTLGGGPQATTLEVAIYQALRFDFDPARAAALALVQLGLCAVLAAAVLWLAPRDAVASPLRLTARRFDGGSAAARLMDSASLALLATLLLLPLAALTASAIASLSLSALFFKALLTSLIFAGLTATLACAMAVVLAGAAGRSRGFARAGQLASVAGLALPPAVIATGWFMIAINAIGLAAVAPLLIVLLNALLALPYAYRMLLPAAKTLATQDRLAESLSLEGWNRLRLDLRALRHPLTAAFAMAFVLALGDLAAILFFGDGRYVTLPALIYQQMGSYRMEGAAGTALGLALIAWAILLAAGKGARDADA